MNRLLLPLGLLVLNATALALDVTDYEAAIHGRFSGGWPNAPVPNTSPSFVGASYDWSGVGWKAEEPTHSVAMITPRHFVFSMHNGVQAGGKIRFVNREGELREYVVERTDWVVIGKGADGNPIHSDTGVGTLEHSIPRIDHVAHYPTVSFGADIEAYLGKPLLLYGHGGPGTPRIGTNEIVDGILGEGEDPHFKFLVQGLIAGMARPESGDSGGPTFMAHDGKLAIVGTHHEANSDVLLPGLAEPIDAIVKRDGYQFEVIDAGAP